MLVSACRKIVSATSAVLCGFLFAYVFMVRRSSSFSFRPLLLPSPSLPLPFLFLLRFFLSSPSPFSSSLSIYMYIYIYNRGGRFYLEATLQMIHFNQSILESYCHDARASSGNFLGTAKSHSDIQVFFFVFLCERENFNTYSHIFLRISDTESFLILIVCVIQESEII